MRRIMLSVSVAGQKLIFLFLFLIPIVLFAAGYFYSSYRSSTRESVSGVDPFAPNVSNLPKTKEEKYDRLKKLSPEVQISYFGDLLGKPVYINYFDSNTNGYKFLKDEIREYIFVDTDYYVQAITDKHDKVMSFAVTSRKEDFNPVLPWGSAVKATLNKTPFSEWIEKNDQSNPLLCYRFTSAHTLYLYFEEAYFGNPGHYLTYLVGINSAGYFPDFIPSGDDGNYGGMTKCKTVDQESRTRLAPNTYIIRGISFFSFVNISEVTKNDPKVFFGPDPVLVRTLNE